MYFLESRAPRARGAMTRHRLLEYLPFPQSVLSYWPLDGSYNDRSGNGHTLSAPHYAPSLVGGIQGGAYRFNGVAGSTASYLAPTSLLTSTVKSLTQISIIAWIKRPDLSTASQPIYFECVQVNDIRFYFALTSTTGDLYVAMKSTDAGSYHTCQATVKWATNRWYCVAATVDTDGDSFKLFRNGIVVGKSAPAAGAFTATAAASIAIGSSAYIAAPHASNVACNLDITEMALYKRIIPEQEIFEYYHRAIGAATKKFWYVSATYEGVISESGTAVDETIGRSSNTYESLSETATASDEILGENIVKQKSLTEDAFAVDTLSYYMQTQHVELTEEALADDAITGQFSFGRDLNEEATAVDEVIIAAPNEGDFTETAIVTDTATYQHIYTSDPHTGTYKIQIGGQIYTSIFQRVRQDYDCTEKVFGTSARQEYTIWLTLLLKLRQYYGIEMVHLRPTARFFYDLTTRAIFRRGWGGGLQLSRYNIYRTVGTVARQYESIRDFSRITYRKRLYYQVRDNDQFTENVSYNTLILLDGADVTSKIRSCQVNYSLSQYTGECSIVWADRNMYAQLDPLTLMGTLRLHVYTGVVGGPLIKQGEFLIEKRSLEVNSAAAFPTSWGRTVTAKLSAPHSVPITRSWDNDTKALTIAIDIINTYAPYISMQWNIADYDVLGGNFTADSETPIDLISRLASPLGGIVTTNKLGQLVIRYQYV